MNLVLSHSMPDIRRTDATAVVVSHWHVPDRDRGLAELGSVVDEWSEATWPSGFLYAGCYLNTDDDTVLIYAQYADTGELPPAPSGAATVEYRLRHSVVVDPDRREPGCMIIAMFDVDGPSRQDQVVTSLTETLGQTAQPTGLLTANFHVSTDGSRVLNYAEWTSDEAHVAFLDGATRAKTLRVSNAIPGVRPIGFKRYHLWRSIGS